MAEYGGIADAQLDPCYHEACDTFANVNDHALDVNSDPIAFATLTFAYSTESVNGVAGQEGARAAVRAAGSGRRRKGRSSRKRLRTVDGCRMFRQPSTVSSISRCRTTRPTTSSSSPRPSSCARSPTTSGCEIVALLRERAATTTELAGQVGLAKGTVAHHLKVLEGAGLVKVVRTRRVRALTESFYGRVARLYVIKSADDKPQARVRLSPADAASFQRRVERLLRDFRGRCVGARRGVRAGRGPLSERRSEVKLRRPGGLWLHRDFRSLWAAETVNEFGSQSRPRACLVAISSSTRPVLRSRRTEASTSLPFILFTLPGGRPGRSPAAKPILVIGDLGRFAALA